MRLPPQIGVVVSIRARHCWRAMPCTYLCSSGLHWFQSAPAIAGGRCSRRSQRRSGLARFQSAPAIAGGRCPRTPRHTQRRPSFNPRPPLLAGDAPHWDWWHAHGLFQSAPAIAGGRCLFGNAASAVAALFQSAPAIAGGRCGNDRGHARGTAGFNPRPPLLAGDAWRCPPQLAWWRVSIRARHCWRAMRAWTSALRWPGRFQSAPAIAGGRCVFEAHRLCGIKPFQSAPAIAGGRCPSR